MNNLALFICGLAITLFSGLGIIVYTVSLGYNQNDKKKFIEPDTDLGAVDLDSMKRHLDSKFQQTTFSETVG